MGVVTDVREPLPYDFGVSSRLSREAVVGLKKIHAATADELEVRLSRSFGDDIRVVSVDVSQVRYETFVNSAQTGSYHFVMFSNPLGGQFQAAFDPESTMRMLALVFGCEVTQTSRELSLVDARVLDSRVGLFIDALNQSFRPYFDMQLEAVRSMVNPKQVKIIDDDETVVQADLRFSVGVSKAEFTLRLCYPQDVVTPVLVALSDVERASATEALTRNTPIQKSLMGVRLPVSVQLPSWLMGAADVEHLDVGDVIRTGVLLESNPRLCVSGRALLDVSIFSSHQRVAAEVVGVHDPRKDQHGK
jgi:flagellar motor switch protein FliM